MPVVSVILTTCGRWALLEQAVQSVLAQDYQDFELIVVADSKSIPSESIHRRMDKQVEARYIVNRRDGTKRVASSCNVGLDHAQGRYAAYLCDDDVWTPGHLSRLMACVDEGARWAVDRCRWLRPDGVLMDQEQIGMYHYVDPKEEGHDDLAQALVDGIGSNFAVHDCVLHEITEDRWPTDAEHHTPVDWRFWCSLRRRGLRPVCVREVGAVAFLPGAWRSGMTEEQATNARQITQTNGDKTMSKNSKLDGLARNTSGKTRIITREGKKVRVMKDGLVPIRDIAKVDLQGNVRLPLGFLPELEDYIVPALEGPPGEGEFATVDEVLENKTKEHATVDMVIASKVEESIPEADKLAAMGYNEVRAIAKCVGVKGLNRPKLDIVRDVEALRGTGATIGDGSCTDAGTITSADIARLPENS